MPQTSVTAPAAGQEGTFATSAARGVSSRVANGAVPVGKFVVQGTAEADCELPNGDIDGGIGIALLDPTQIATDYADNEMVAIATDGEVFVITEDACQAGGAVYVRTTAGGSGFGSFRATVTEATLLPNAYFKTDSGAGELAIVKFRAP